MTSRQLAIDKLLDDDSAMPKGFVASEDGARIHYASSDGFEPTLPALVFVPGMLGVVDFYERELREFGPRRVVAFSHRGLGQSRLPEKPGSASFYARCTDIAAVASGLKLSSYFLCGFSRGVSLCVAHTLKYPSEVRGLILLDCDARYVKPSPAWLEGLKVSRHPEFHLEAITRYFEDAEDVDLTDRLSRIKMPVLIVRGEQKGSLLAASKAEEMRRRLQHAKVITLPNSAHGVADADFDLFKKVIMEFMR